MKIFNRIGFILTLVILLSSSSVAFAKYYKDNKVTLRDLKGVGVLIEYLKPEIRKDGLTEGQIKTDVTLKLKSAGIKVLSDEESKTSSGKPFLYVNANIAKLSNNKSYVYSISAELKQTVRLRRDITISSSAITWGSGSVGMAFDINFIRTSIKDLIDDFINAYLTVNRK